MNAALEHLGNVLHLLSDLHPDDRTRALDNALEFYNKKRPNRRIEPSGFPMQRLVNSSKRGRIRNDTAAPTP